MGKNGSVIVLFLLFIIFFGQSDALNSRKLFTTPDPNGSSNANQDSQSSSPPTPEKKPNHSPPEAPKPKDAPITSSSDLQLKKLNDTHTKKGSEDSSDKKLVNGKNQDGKTLANESCKRNLICNDQGKTITACVQDSENGSNNLTLIVQNEQDVALKVNIKFGTSNIPPLKIPAHGTEKVNITFSGDKSNKVILNAGNGDCELQISQPSPADSVAKPKEVTKPADSSTKPKEVNSPPDDPTKPKEVDNPAKSKEEKDPSNKSKGTDDPLKSKDVDDPPNSKVGDDQPKSKDTDDPSNPKVGDSPSKSKGTDDPSKSKGTDPSKSKGADDPSNSKVGDDPSKSKVVDDPSKLKGTDDPSKSTTTNVNAPVSKTDFFDQLTLYSKQVTPIYGAYLAFLVALVAGGSWALCSCRKRRTNGGVPYQELEMGPTESSTAIDVEAVEGWEHDWDDDDWDEDKAIRSPGGAMNAKSISSNGLTSRATRKDSWDADWDD